MKNKQIHLQKPKLIILMGLPGAGKSYLANWLEKKHKAKVLSGEDMAVKMFGTSRCKAGEYSLVYQTIRQQAQKLLKKGFTVVIDGTNLKYEYRKAIYEEVGREDTILVYLPIDDKIALERLKKRGGCDKKTFYEFKKKLEEPKKEEKTRITVVKLNQNHPSQVNQQKVEIILEKLPSSLAKEKT